MHQYHTWQLTGELVPRAKDEAEHVGEVLLHLLDDLYLQPSHAYKQGTGLGAPHLASPQVPHLSAVSEELSGAEANQTIKPKPLLIWG